MLTIEKKSLKVGKYVDSRHVDTLVRNYKQERWAANSEQLGKEDTLSVWYSVDELEEFIHRAKEAGANGIRMHFGVYSQDGSDRPEQEYAGMLTMVMVATKKKFIEGGFTEKKIYTNTENGYGILAYNMSQGCPYSCGTPGRTGGTGGDDDGWGGIGITIVDRGDKGMEIV